MLSQKKAQSINLINSLSLSVIILLGLCIAALYKIYCHRWSADAHAATAPLCDVVGELYVFGGEGAHHETAEGAASLSFSS